MPSFEVRPFRRGDRDQLTALVNGHAAVVMPGASVSVNTVLQQLEREPGELIVGPWMSDRLTLVAEQDGAIVAAAEPGPPPMAGLEVRRSLGINGTRLSAVAGGDQGVGYIEVDLLDQAERHPRGAGLADVGNLWVDADHHRQGVGTWLLRHAAARLRLGRVDRLLDYTHPEEAARLAFLAANGFQVITRCRKGWALPAQGTITARPVTLPS